MSTFLFIFYIISLVLCMYQAEKENDTLLWWFSIIPPINMILATIGIVVGIYEGVKDYIKRPPPEDRYNNEDYFS